MRQFSRALVFTASILLSFAGELQAQVRQGVWVGHGYGGMPLLNLSCTGCFSPAEWKPGGGGAMQVGFGSTITPQVLAGAGVNYMGSTGDTSASVLAALALVRYYPMGRRGLHIQAGVGASSITFGRPGGSAETFGQAVQLGLGYDMRVWRTFALTPYVSLTAVRAGGGSVRTHGNVGPVTRIAGGTAVQWGIALHMY